MKIVQLSDFHFKDDTNIAECIVKVDKLFEAIQGEIGKDEQLIFCICGDVTDKGNINGYSHAEQILNYLKTKFHDYTFNFEFTPGNHDLCEEEFIKFDSFIEGFLVDKYKYQNECIIKREYGDINIILVNSAFHQDYGTLDLDGLRRSFRESNKKSIIVTHHAIVSRYEDDDSSIRQAYDLVKLIQEYKVISVLHGHTHGYSDINVSQNCNIIGVGPMFKKVADINNQFNLISIIAEKVDKIINYRYSADLNSYAGNCVFERKNRNIFHANMASEVFYEVLEETKAYGCINSLNICIDTDCNSFFSDVERNFSSDIEIAKQWQAQELPSTLYYNHGMYMHKKGKDGLEYIIEELKRKATSSRAILPLINVHDVIGSGDDFLPSLDVIQFGFSKEDKTKLYVTLYLRALEVSHFLKINFSEIYLMVQRLKKEILSITNLNINVLAFKVQYKESYSCFQKADIDQLDAMKMTIIVYKKNIDKIIELLENKIQLTETVVHVQGLLYLYNSIKCCEEEEKEDYYSGELIKSIELLLVEMNDLQELRRKTSDYVVIEDKEKSVHHQMGIVTGEFKKLLGGEKI